MPAKSNMIHLYNGEETIMFYPDSHRFKRLGDAGGMISVTGVTGIVDKSRVLMDWASKLSRTHLYAWLEKQGDQVSREELYRIVDEAVRQYEVKREEAASTGSKVHDWVERFALAQMAGKAIDPGSLDALEPQVLNGVNAFLDWFNAHEVKYLAAERIIYSRLHNYVGICDAVAEVNGVPTVIDYKTAKGFYSDQRYQVSGYWGAIEEEDQKEYGQGLILKFGKEDGVFDVLTLDREEHAKNYETFLACLVVKRREKELENEWRKGR